MWVLQLFTRLIGKSHHGSVLSREDFTAMADIAHEEGVFEESESKVIKNLLQFDEVRVKDVMTPRTVLKIAPESQTIESFFRENPRLRFSRIPVYGEREDLITGFVLKDNVLEEMINENGDMPLSEIRRDLLVTRRDTPIPQLFETFIRKREHIALVVDEYGDIQGMVTLDDILEEIVGEYTAESRAKTRDIRLLDDGNFLVNGSVSIRTLNRKMDWHLPEEEASTLNGLVLEELGEIPSGKASLKIGRHILTVLEIKDNKIARVLVKPERLQLP